VKEMSVASDLDFDDLISNLTSNDEDDEFFCFDNETIILSASPRPQARPIYDNNSETNKVIGFYCQESKYDMMAQECAPIPKNSSTTCKKAPGEVDWGDFLLGSCNCDHCNTYLENLIKTRKSKRDAKRDDVKTPSEDFKVMKLDSNLLVDAFGLLTTQTKKELEQRNGDISGAKSTPPQCNYLQQLDEDSSAVGNKRVVKQKVVSSDDEATDTTHSTNTTSTALNTSTEMKMEVDEVKPEENITSNKEIAKDTNKKYRRTCGQTGCTKYSQGLFIIYKPTLI
jgi:hypothetical protein